MNLSLFIFHLAPQLAALMGTWEWLTNPGNKPQQFPLPDFAQGEHPLASHLLPLLSEASLSGGGEYSCRSVDSWSLNSSSMNEQDNTNPHKDAVSIKRAKMLHEAFRSTSHIWVMYVCVCVCVCVLPGIYCAVCPKSLQLCLPL